MRVAALPFTTRSSRWAARIAHTVAFADPWRYRPWAESAQLRRGVVTAWRIDPDALLFVRIVAGHNGNRLGFGTEIDRLVREARRDEDEVAGFVHTRFSELWAIERLDFAFEEVDGRFKSVMVVRLRSRTWGDDDNVHRNGRGSCRLVGDPYVVGKSLKRVNGHLGSYRDDVAVKIHGFLPFV